jgi:hypothetical protein
VWVTGSPKNNLRAEALFATILGGKAREDGPEGALLLGRDRRIRGAKRRDVPSGAPTRRGYQDRLRGGRWISGGKV